jgi:hypothetical protein
MGINLAEPHPVVTALPPDMLIKELRVATTAATSDLTPTSGKRIRVLGIWACCTVEGNLTSTVRATLAFGTDHTTDTSKILASHRCGKGDVAHCTSISAINVLGAVDEKVRLTNVTFTVGTVVYRTIIYYREE